MNYKLTIFKNRYDNKTHKNMTFKSWDNFVGFLNQLSKVPVESKTDAALISMASYYDGTTRANKNVEAWSGWVALDIDELEITKDKLYDYLSSRLHDWSFVCYSTASCKPDQAKCRLVLDLGQNLDRDRIKQFWFALNNELESIGDKQTKDLSRMFYVPAKYAGADNFIITRSGNPVDVDYLIAKHPYKEKEGKSFLDRLPSELQQAVVNHRKQALDNTSFTWTDYRDCPFWPKKLAIEYISISETGWYHKMYQIMVACAGKAISKGYPITAREIATLCKQFDVDNGNWYENRPIEVEADRALEYAYRNN